MKQRGTSLYDMEAMILFAFVAIAYLLNTDNKHITLGAGVIAVTLLHYRLSVFLKSRDFKDFGDGKGRFNILREFYRKELKVVVLVGALLVLSLLYSLL